MSSFTVGSLTSASFTVTEDGFSDKSGLLEEWSASVITDDDTAWGALFALVTPKELVSVRACRGTQGVPATVSVDIGGGAGVGTLVIDDYNTHSAILLDLSSDAPIVTNGQRLCKSSWLILP